MYIKFLSLASFSAIIFSVFCSCSWEKSLFSSHTLLIWHPAVLCQWITNSIVSMWVFLPKESLQISNGSFFLTSYSISRWLNTNLTEKIILKKILFLVVSILWGDVWSHPSKELLQEMTAGKVFIYLFVFWFFRLNMSLWNSYRKNQEHTWRCILISPTHHIKQAQASFF